MTQQWADISEADKAQCALEAAARNQAACQAKPSTTAVLDSVSDEGERCAHMLKQSLYPLEDHNNDYLKLHKKSAVGDADRVDSPVAVHSRNVMHGSLDKFHR